MSDTAVSYDFEQLEPSEPPPRGERERLLTQAVAEAEQIREQARAEGHAEGLATGMRDGAEQVGAAVAALAQALEELHALRAQVAEAVERDAVELALALAAKILAGALQARPELVIEVVQGALRRASDRRQISVVLNPADLETVSAAIGDLRAHASAVELHDLVADQRVPAGGALVRTSEGEIDASVATQLERAREVILAELAADG